jgi:hypothetical protein
LITLLVVSLATGAAYLAFWTNQERDFFSLRSPIVDPVVEDSMTKQFAWSNFGISFAYPPEFTLEEMGGSNRTYILLSHPDNFEVWLDHKQPDLRMVWEISNTMITTANGMLINRVESKSQETKEYHYIVYDITLKDGKKLWIMVDRVDYEGAYDFDSLVKAIAESVEHIPVVRYEGSGIYLPVLSGAERALTFSGELGESAEKPIVQIVFDEEYWRTRSYPNKTGRVSTKLTVTKGVDLVGSPFCSTNNMGEKGDPVPSTETVTFGNAVFAKVVESGYGMNQQHDKERYVQNINATQCRFIELYRYTANAGVVANDEVEMRDIEANNKGFGMTLDDIKSRLISELSVR